MTLFDWSGANHFDGDDYNPATDHARLTTQLDRVRDAMAGGRWRTLADVSEVSGAPEASVSAQLRNLRKERFGSYVVERRRSQAGNGLYEYRLVSNDDGAA